MRISKFLPDDKLVCKGTATIDVNGAPIEIPITSKGILELRDELLMHKPIAPKKALVIRANTDIGRELELKEDTVKLVTDEADAAYLRNVAAFDIELIWQIVICGVDLEFEDSKGKPLTEYEDKRSVLLANGLTIEHLNTLFNAILRLGKQAEEDIEDYIQRSVGLTSAIQSKVISRAKKQGGAKNSAVFNSTRVMTEYGIDPEAWEALHSVDKRILNYSLLLKYHQEAEQMEAMERQQKLESNKQKVMGKLPTFSGGGR